MDSEIFNHLNMAQLVKILIVVAGFITFTLSILAIIRGKHAKSWNKTEGEILKSEFIEFGTSGDSERIFKPKVKYKYVIKGIEYCAKRVYFGSSLMSNFKKRNSLRTVAKYPEGKKITVFYNPSNVKMSVLETGVKSEIIITSIIGILIFLFGYLLLTNPELLENIRN